MEGAQVSAGTLDPLALGLEVASADALAGGDLATNQAILEAVLQGRGTRAQRDVVALNTALVLWAAGRCDSVAEALPVAQAALSSGEAWGRLLALRSALASDGAGG